MGEQRIPQLILEQIVLDEIDDKDKWIRSIGEIDGGIEQIKALQEENEEFLKKYPPEEMAKRIQSLYAERLEQAQESRKGLLSRFLSWLEGLRIPKMAIGAVLALFIMIPALVIVNNQSNPDMSGVRFKGESNLFVYRKTLAGEELLKDGDIARKGDVIQLMYLVTDFQYGVIFSIDGIGNLTWHYPYSLQNEAKLDIGKKSALSEAYELDNAPLFEHFFMILSSQKPSMKTLVEKANHLAESRENLSENASRIFDSYRIISVRLRKQ